MIAIALLLLSLTSISSALILHLPAGRVKCLTDDLRPGTVSVGRYHISHDDHHLHSHNVSARVNDPRGETVHRADGVEEGEFAFVAAAEGRYTACFWSSRFERDAALELEFEWRSGVATKGWTAVVKKDKIDERNAATDRIATEALKYLNLTMVVISFEIPGRPLIQSDGNRVEEVRGCSWLHT